MDGNKLLERADRMLAGFVDGATLEGECGYCGNAPGNTHTKACPIPRVNRWRADYQHMLGPRAAPSAAATKEGK